ncbi:heterokaryon incompatibility protein-domain-containing protein [Fusarium solani]|uniref:Heterokaryon incompatibility protein-domain-containing protein n=1 Tax=Fusarium solani TaxID=169388 RepID=A0A9P9GKW5_FUSSL|nr:heterokaryon incompatibility protein-domain-containing protein [Fusarium solani]KAH7240533.1 heterokaryon incompatibility protein-domain-containing protein [Fusarium solani]
MAIRTPLQKDEIRLLRLSSKTESASQPVITFEQVSLSDPEIPSFVALSYVWGDLEDTLPLHVSGEVIPATRNLHVILQCLSSANFDQFLWIDALCINQNDLLERAAQVALMGGIYSRASYVLAFLSPLSEPFDLGLDFLQEAARDSELHYEPSLSPHISVNDLTASSESLRDSLISFFAAPWWTRVWTVQEYALAAKVIFQCGNRQMEGSVVLTAFRNLATHERKCCWAARRAADGNARGFLDYPSEANNGLTLFKATLRINNLNSIVNSEAFGVQDLLDATSLFRTRQCSDPRDRVFGLLGLHLKDDNLQRMLPTDYTIPTALLYRNLAMAAIENSQTLDVLSHVLHRPSIHKRTPGLPSWVPDWDALMDDDYHLMYTERSDKLRHFSASKDLKPKWILHDSGLVTTHGFQFAKIAATAPGYPDPDSTTGGKQLLEKWRQLSGLPQEPIAAPNGDSDESKREWAFQRSLCGNVTLSQWADHSCNHTAAYNTWHSWFTHPEPASLPEDSRSTAREFDFLVQIASLGRCFFVTEDGDMAFGPELAQAGDVVVIIPGGRVPYVLRKVDSSDGLEDQAPVYEFVGDAFVDCTMVGEKVEGSPTFEDMVII